MECPHCKLSTSIQDGRCALCGWTLLVCPGCGAANETTALHCGACGSYLGSGRDPDEAADDGVEEHHIY
jgi:hypothetical protein